MKSTDHAKNKKKCGLLFLSRSKRHYFFLEREPRERLCVKHARDGTYLVDDDRPELLEIVRLDLRDEIVLAEQRVQFHNLRYLRKLVVDLMFMCRCNMN